LPIRADTVIRALRAAPDPPSNAVRVLGLDEWAKRKGQTYATALVDQERHRIVDVLPDDQPETVAAWLQAHPTIQGVTRDRDKALAKAMAAGAPIATQGADRLHRLQNLRAVLERVFQRHPPTVPTPGPAADPELPPCGSSRASWRGTVSSGSRTGRTRQRANSSGPWRIRRCARRIDWRICSEAW